MFTARRLETKRLLSLKLEVCATVNQSVSQGRLLFQGVSLELALSAYVFLCFAGFPFVLLLLVADNHTLYRGLCDEEAIRFTENPIQVIRDSVALPNGVPEQLQPHELQKSFFLEQKHPATAHPNKP